MSKANIIALGRDGELSCAAKSCTGSGLRTLREWLAGCDVVILFGGRGAPPVVVASWEACSLTSKYRRELAFVLIDQTEPKEFGDPLVFCDRRSAGRLRAPPGCGGRKSIVETRP